MSSRCDTHCRSKVLSNATPIQRQTYLLMHKCSRTDDCSHCADVCYYWFTAAYSFAAAAGPEALTSHALSIWLNGFIRLHHVSLPVMVQMLLPAYMGYTGAGSGRPHGRNAYDGPRTAANNTAALPATRQSPEVHSDVLLQAA